jgi:hypothetical protein
VSLSGGSRARRRQGTLPYVSCVGAAKLPSSMAAIDTGGATGRSYKAQRLRVRWDSANWRRAPDAFSPIVLFPVCWLFGIALAQIHILEVQKPWSGTVWLVMFWVPIAFLLGGIIGDKLAILSVKANPHVRPLGETLSIRESRRLPWLLLALTAVGLAGVTYQFVHAHNIPLLTSHIDMARTSLPGGPTIVALDALVVAAILAMVLPERLLSRAGLPYLAIATLALFALALTGGRGNLIVPPAVAMLARWRLGRRPELWSLAAVSVFVLGTFSIIFYLRAGQETSQAWAAELLGRVVYHMPAPLVPLLPLWLAVAMNFNSLARVVAYYPSHHAYGNGIYDARALHMFIHSAPLDVSQLTAPWTLSTFAGPFWADGGFIALTLGSALIGAITTFAYRAARRSGRIGHLFVSCYMLFLAVFCLYQDMFTIYFDWILVTIGLLVAGVALEPGSGGGRDRLGRFARHAAVSVRTWAAARR